MDPLQSFWHLGIDDLLTLDEVLAVRLYTGPAYLPINWWLRQVACLPEPPFPVGEPFPGEAPLVAWNCLPRWRKIFQNCGRRVSRLASKREGARTTAR